MGRLHLFEFEDQSWFPSLLREYMTDYLAFTASLTTAPFERFAQKLKEALVATQQTQLLDLCSGASGPLPQVVKLLREKEQYPVTATLTDLYPNITAFRKTEALANEISHLETSVDATQVTPDLKGFRTLFNGFHHFSPEKAGKILENAARTRQGIAVLELVDRSAFGFFSVATLLIAVPMLTPFMRPFRVSRLVFTYLVPVLPFLMLWDGWVSCFRVYSLEELKVLTDGIRVNGYTWEMGKLQVGNSPAAVTYLMGRPASS